MVPGSRTPSRMAAKLRVTVFETANFAVHMKYAIDCFQICMALGTGLIAGGGNVDGPRARYDMSHTRGFLFGFRDGWGHS